MGGREERIEREGRGGRQLLREGEEEMDGRCIHLKYMPSLVNSSRSMEQSSSNRS